MEATAKGKSNRERQGNCRKAVGNKSSADSRDQDAKRTETPHAA